MLSWRCSVHLHPNIVMATLQRGATFPVGPHSSPGAGVGVAIKFRLARDAECGSRDWQTLRKTAGMIYVSSNIVGITTLVQEDGPLLKRFQKNGEFKKSKLAMNLLNWDARSWWDINETRPRMPWAWVRVYMKLWRWALGTEGRFRRTSVPSRRSGLTTFFITRITRKVSQKYCLSLNVLQKLSE